MLLSYRYSIVRNTIITHQHASYYEIQNLGKRNSIILKTECKGRGGGTTNPLAQKIIAAKNTASWSDATPTNPVTGHRAQSSMISRYRRSQQQ